MKINYKNTALNLLDKWDEEVSIPEPHVPMTEVEKKVFGHSVLSNLQKCGDLFRNNVRFVSIPFMEAYQRGKHKLIDVFDKEEMDEGGTIIYKAEGWTKTIFYYLKSGIVDDHWDASYLFMEFSKYSQNDFKALDVCISGHDRVEKTFIYKDHFDAGWTHSKYFSFLVSFLCFIKHVELETKEVKANSRGHHIGTKYVNETKSNIQILDSTWFTTIVRSEGFHVRGHFRLQPHGPNNSLRKLIWISDFDKEGYTRTAKILNQ